MVKTTTNHLSNLWGFGLTTEVIYTAVTDLNPVSSPFGIQIKLLLMSKEYCLGFYWR